MRLRRGDLRGYLKTTQPVPFIVYTYENGIESFRQLEHRDFSLRVRNPFGNMRRTRLCTHGLKFIDKHFHIDNGLTVLGNGYHCISANLVLYNLNNLAETCQ